MAGRRKRKGTEASVGSDPGRRTAATYFIDISAGVGRGPRWSVSFMSGRSVSRLAA